MSVIWIPATSRERQRRVGFAKRRTTCRGTEPPFTEPLMNGRVCHDLPLACGGRAGRTNVRFQASYRGAGIADMGWRAVF
jgi:hypothetical protein